MEGIGRKLRIGAVLGLLAGGLLLGWAGLRGRSPAPLPPVSAGASPSSGPVPAWLLDLDRLYDLDHLVLVGDPPRLDLGRPGAPVLASDAARGGRAVPEPALLWILGLAALYTLYLPPGSW